MYENLLYLLKENKLTIENGVDITCHLKLSCSECDVENICSKLPSTLSTHMSMRMKRENPEYIL